VVILEPGREHWTILRDLLTSADIKGPLVMDAHLAALAMEHEATLCTADKDFTRLVGVKPDFPLTESEERRETQEAMPKPPDTPGSKTG
ncbi:MAG: type II toxin-antitoxin system VapC family toxin, partial [bacterium]|nr:type II toxin-antitoxin system VapC family toxin [bacterium]